MYGHVGCSQSVFGVSAESMQCSYDKNGNSVPTILLLMQERLYHQGGLKVCRELNLQFPYWICEALCFVFLVEKASWMSSLSVILDFTS